MQAHLLHGVVQSSQFWPIPTEAQVKKHKKPTAIQQAGYAALANETVSRMQRLDRSKMKNTTKGGLL